MKMKSVLRLTLLALIVGALAVPVMAGSAVIGSVAGTMNATVGGQSLLPNTTLFSGDSLQVRDGVAVIAVGSNNRVILGRDTVASFLRESNEVTVLLTQGNVSMLHPNGATTVRVKAGAVSIAPVGGFKTLGEVAMLNGTIVVTSKEGTLQVNEHGTTRNVAKGQTIVLSPKTADNKGGGTGWGGSCPSCALEIVTLGAAGAGAILAGIAMSRAGNANTNALDAISAANAATSAANAATSQAAAATAAASSAAASASQADLLAQCLYDLKATGTYSSPYVLDAAQCAGTGM